jgi:hypothetical protein
VVGLRILALHLNPGSYRLGLRLYDPIAKRAFDRLESAFDLEVIDLQPEVLGRKAGGVATCRFEVFECDAGGVAPIVSSL